MALRPDRIDQPRKWGKWTVIPASMADRNLGAIDEAIEALGPYPDVLGPKEVFHAYHDRATQIIDLQLASLHEALERRSDDLLADTRVVMRQLISELVLRSKFNESGWMELAIENDIRDGTLE